MARSKQNKAAPRAPTAHMRRATPPSTEDPPTQESRRTPTPNATRGNRTNQATEQNDNNAQDEDEDKDDEIYMSDLQASARQISTVREAKQAVKVAKKAVKACLAETAVTKNSRISLATARYEVKIMRERREELREEAALRAQQQRQRVSAQEGGLGSGEERATTARSRSRPVPRNGDRRDASVAASGSRGQEEEEEEGPGDEVQHPSLRQSPRNRNGGGDPQVRQNGSNDQDQTTADPDSDDNLPTQQKWPHNPKKWWGIRGITRESAQHYKVAWKGTTEKGEQWDSTWQRKTNVNAKAKLDWNRRKGDRRLWKDVDGESTEEEEEEEDV